MKSNRVLNIGAGLAMIALAGLSVADDLVFYRYVNEQGNKVIVDQLPPEAVSRGYEVINRDGGLIRRVARQLTEEELLDQHSELAQERMRKEEERRLKAWDESLMLRYSAIEDIEAARERAIRSIHIRISILKSNRGSVKSEIELEQSRAADVERRGRAVPKELVEKINVLQDEIKDIEDSITAREQEVVDIQKRFQRDIERFTTLQDRIRLRNQAHQRPSKKSLY